MKPYSLIKALLASISVIGFSSMALAANSTLNYQLTNSQLIQKFGKTYRQYDDMLIEEAKFKTQSQFDLTKNKWTDGKVYYQYADNVTTENRQQFVKATEIWAENAQLEFIESSGEGNYIRVESGSGNFATVGMVGGQQTLTMINWENLYIIVHELGHSLGMWHEQQRANRDDYISVVSENILDNQVHNFNIQNTSNYGTYDFLSIMHYSRAAWSKNGSDTLVPKAGFENFAKYMGQRSFFSGGEQLSVASHYGAKIISIPDPAFKSYLLSHFDLNQDQQIDTLEAASIEAIKTPGNGQIQSIEGIRYFRFLKSLDVSNESVSQIDSLPNHLTHLNISNNQFQSVDSRWVLGLMVSQIVATGNPIDEYSCDAIDFIESSLGKDGFNYSPVASGSELICDDNARAVLFSGKTKFDLRAKGERSFFIDVPANTQSISFVTEDFEQVAGNEMNLYVAYNRTPTTSDYDQLSTETGNHEIININQPAMGRWYVLLSPVDRSFERVNLTATLNSLTETITPLEKGVAINNLSALEGNSLEFFIDVAENANDLSVIINGGSGDADLYVRYGTKPELDQYDCRPWKTGNSETCQFSSPTAGRYYIKLVGYNAFSGLSLVADYQIGSNGNAGHQLHQSLNANAGAWLDFPIQIPQNITQLQVQVSGGTGDADLYVRYGAQPTQTQYQCRPYASGNQESCAIANPSSGTWYVSLFGYNSFSGVTLEIDWQ